MRVLYIYGNEIFVEVLREGVAEASVQFVRAISRPIDWNAREVEQERVAVGVEQVGDAWLAAFR